MNRSVLPLALIFAALLALSPTSVLGQGLDNSIEESVTVSSPSASAPSVRAVVSEASVEVDGRLDDPLWADARLVTGFIQGEPIEGVPAEEETEVRIVFGDDAIYVAARMFDSAPESIADQLVRRDQWGTFDWFSVSLDPNLDRRTGYEFRVSASGVQGDSYLYDDSREDRAWDAVWASAVERDSEGWTAEFRIPLSQIRFNADEDPQTWGVNFTRRRVSTNEVSYFALQSRSRTGKVSQFGTLDGVLLESATRRIEARPYVLSSVYQGPSESGDPFFDGSSATGRIGTDLRVGLGSSFTLDATINPDFGQVESDPAVINLSAFEVFQQERRPFFVEDARVLDFSLSGRRNSLFYSRRIGRSPHGRAPSGADFSDSPDAATIIGSAKLTGRTAGGLSIGALAALTQAETGRAAYTDESGEVEYLAEPRAEFGVVRLQQDLNGGNTQVGGIVTSAFRSLPSDGGFDYLPSSAYSAGIDFGHQWSNRAWAVRGFFAGSHVRGDEAAITRIQRASNHLFHRPDASRLAVDSTATSLTGAEWQLRVEKQNGEHWAGGLWFGQTTSGFEVNDLGFSQNSEKLDLGFRVNYQEITPGDLFRNYNISFFTFQNFSHELFENTGSLDWWSKSLTNSNFSLNTRVELLNWWGASLDLGWGPDTFSRNATRGGPIMKDPGSWRSSLRVNGDRRKAVSFSGSASYSRSDESGARNMSFGGGVQIRPTPTLEVEVEPRWSQQTNGAQYVTSASTLPFEPTYGRRYLFAELDRTTLSMEVRANLSVSPTLTFQLFAQPLISAGDYVRYRQLSEAGSFDFVDFQQGNAIEAEGDTQCVSGVICYADGNQHVDFDGDGTVDYAFRDRDFNVMSLVGNAVLRWEYRPGSTVYLVWQRQQAGRAATGDFDLGRDVDALWGAPAENTFMIKVNYWLGL